MMKPLNNRPVDSAFTPPWFPPGKDRCSTGPLTSSIKTINQEIRMKPFEMEDMRSLKLVAHRDEERIDRTFSTLEKQ
jgi:hypothetical protein